jgi:folate-binding protein YgfZ
MKYIILNRSLIKISGSDAHKFLQGLVSNDVGKANNNNAVYAYLLTPQGKYIFDMFIYKFEDGFVVDISSNYLDSFLKKIKLYKLRSDVLIKDISSEYSVAAIISSEKPNVSNLFEDPRNINMGFRAIIKNENLDNVISKLNLEKADYKDYTKLRIENLVTEGEFDLEQEKSFPLQYRMIENNAVCFKKGCYVGQEVTARTHHRGVVRKTIYKISADKNLDNIENKIIECTTPQGKIEAGRRLSTSSNMALAYLDIDLVEKKSEFFIGDILINLAN